MTKTYRSKVDTWLLIVIIAAMGAGLVGAVAALLAGGHEMWWAIVPVALAVALPAWVLTSTFYRLTDDELLVRSGPFSWRIPTAEIHRVTSTNNPLSSPALSLQRLKIEYGNGKRIMISPENQTEFIADLKSVSNFDLG